MFVSRPTTEAALAVEVASVAGGVEVGVAPELQAAASIEASTRAAKAVRLTSVLR